MDRKLFTKILGSNFSITKYKVNTLNDLERVLNKQDLDLNKRLYNEEGLFYEFPIGSNPDDAGCFTLMERYHSDSYFTSLHRTREYYNLLTQRLDFKITENSKIEMLERELESLEKQFLENPYYDILTPINYFNEIRSYDFFIKLWTRHKFENLSLFKEFKENFNSKSYDIEDLMEKDVGKGSFKEFFEVLKRFTVVNIHLRQLKKVDMYVEDISLALKKNQYPRIFKHGYAFELFNYLVAVESNDIGPAWATKFFLLFQDEKLIKVKTRPSDFEVFLRKEHNIEIKKWDDRTSFGHDEENYLRDIEKDFKNFYNITRP